MKKFKFGTASLDIKRPLLNKIIDEILCEESPTRNTVTFATGASFTSVRKVMSAMAECKFVYETLKPQKNGRKPCLHQTLNEALAILVLDMSAPIYTMSVVNGNLVCAFFERYRYDSTQSFRDNLMAFLTRLGRKACKVPYGFCAVCVIYPNQRLVSQNFGGISSDHWFPDVDNKKMISAAVCDIFGAEPLLYTSISEALAYAVQYNVSPNAPFGENSAYIFIGSAIYAVGLHKDGQILLIKLANLLTDGYKLASDTVTEAVVSCEFNELLLRSVNVMSCVIDADTYVIESDISKFSSEALRQFKRAFALTGISLPRITVTSRTPGSAVFGTARATVAAFIKARIMDTDDVKKALTNTNLGKDR